jgi:hypothetical protein
MRDARRSKKEDAQLLFLLLTTGSGFKVLEGSTRFGRNEPVVERKSSDEAWIVQPDLLRIRSQKVRCKPGSIEWLVS